MKTFSLCFSAILVLGICKAQNVSEFTGDFSHTEPLFSVPSPTGAGIPVSMMYSAGIGVKQGSGEIGLGWNLIAGGAISRSVSGVPDDWKAISVPNQSKGSVQTHTGVMHFRTSPGQINDFYKSGWKQNDSSFYFPDYDGYFVNGPGIGGQLQPHLFEFTTTDVSTGDFVIGTSPNPHFKKMQFQMAGDFADTIVSRHYQTTPVTSSTSFLTPNSYVDTYDPTIEDSHYPKYVGKYKSGYSKGFDTTNNRLYGSYFIEYFTNSEINTGVTNLMDFKPNHARNSTYYDMDGIGGYRITDPNGFIYHFTLPVYINYTVTGDYPLMDDYKHKGTYDDAKTTSGNSYYIVDADNGNYMTEYKQAAKYAYAWLLVAITGPDFVDDGDKIVDDGDKGYWVSFEYLPWSASFNKRTPEFGFDYSFHPTEDESTQNKDITKTDKISGKFGYWTRINQEIYYLNSISTSSHKALFVRDIRNDEHSSNETYDAEFQKEVNINSNVDPQIGWSGNLYDDGGGSSNYGHSRDDTIHIIPTGADKIQLDFSTFTFASDVGDMLYVYDGPSTSSTQMSGSPFKYNNLPPSSFTSSGSAVTLRLVTNAGVNAAGFRIKWKAKWNDGQPDVTPQLKLTRVILMTKPDANGLTAPSAITSGDGVWDMNNTQPTDANTYKYPASGGAKFYNESWYNTYKTSIDAVTLKSAVLSQDYSLARKYYNNRQVEMDMTTKDLWPNKVHSAVNVISGQYANSGKLTLNEITMYDYKYQKLVPSVKFDYNYSSSSDNPDFNPKTIDYWGMYKSDVTDSAYTGYVTSASKDYTDAWSLRKITSPIGGIAEIEYESDAYEKTFSESGGFKGPSRIYMLRSISSITNDSVGRNWNFVLEDDVADFWDLVNNPPGGTTRQVFLAYTSIQDDSCTNATEWYRSWATGTITQSPHRIKNMTTCYRCSTGAATNWIYESNTIGYFVTGITPPCNKRHLISTGNGYVNFDLPVGSQVYGGGIRVKKITKRVSDAEAYVMEYTYSEGVATAEADRFGKPKQKKDSDGDNLYIKLRPYEGDPHRMGPMVGYSKVTVKNLGRNNIANGAVHTYFITAENGIDNFKVRKKKDIRTSTEWGGISNPCTDLSYNDTSYVVEVVDKFGGLWGKPSRSEIEDVSGNLLSVTRNEYSNPVQGSIVEHYDFVRKRQGFSCNPGSNCSCTQNHHLICIKRTYPTVLSKQTIYSKGSSSVSEYLKFDELTGTPIISRISGPNMDVTVNKNFHAFRNGEQSAMGGKVENSGNWNMVSPIGANRVTVDSTITGNSDFGGFSVSVFNDTFDVRKYSTSNSQFQYTLTSGNFRPICSYIWQGNNSSLSTYGLFKNSDFVAFDWDLSSVDAKWKFLSQITLFDTLGSILETKGVNNRYSAVKYTNSFHLPVASVGNSNYPSFTFCGFEDRYALNGSTYFYEGEVKENSGVTTDSSGTVTPHSGKKVIKLATAATGPSYSVKYNSSNPEKGLTPGRKYRIAAWVYNSSSANVKLSLTLTGQSSKSMAANDANAVTVGSWKMLWFDYDVPSSLNNNDELKIYLENTSGADVYFDDLKMHCADAPINCNVYHPKTGWLIGSLGNDHFATIYKHDAAGRVVEVWQEIEGVGLKKIQKHSFNFGRGLN